ncbi:reverse transcriptase domain-containing protein [Tanacetum coccineum]|uniref:Reverse transcriptase domain-containing protein n=1 Tax=Tanacetum coccineum TaxID=301880 RepID=A0ABQ4ZHI4_9ASTR
MTDKYCPREEMKKLERELWNLKTRGTDVVTYSRRFQELNLMCVWMFSEEKEKIEKYIRGLPDMIHVSVMASKPKSMHEAIEFANELMDQKVLSRQNVGRVYVAGTGNNNQYHGNKPQCPMCKRYHHGACMQCTNCASALCANDTTIAELP